MKTLKIIIIALFISSSMFSQNIDNLSNIKKRKLLNIEIISTAGLKYDGIFISTDDTKTVFYNNTNKNFLSIDNNDIYEINLKQKYTFGKSFGHNMIGATVITSALIMPIFNGDAIMIPPSFIVGFASTIFGIPASLITSGLTRNRNHINIDYIIDKDNSFEIIKPLLQKNNNAFFLKNDKIMKEIISKKDTFILKKRIKPMYNKHPLYVNKFHLFMGTTATFDNIEDEFSKVIKTSDFNSKIYDNSLTTARYNAGLSMNIKDNMRLYLEYVSKNSMEQVTGRTIDVDGIAIESSYSILGGGMEYVFKPTNKLFLKKYEFSLKAGLANNFLNYKIWFERAFSETDNQDNYLDHYQIKETKYNIPSIDFGGSFNYSISRNISFKASLIGSAMMPQQFESIEDVSVNGNKISTGEIKVNIISFKPMVGIEFSL